MSSLRLCHTGTKGKEGTVNGNDSGEPVGYWAYFADPEGNTLEVSFGQRIELTVNQSAAM
ncbi:glyoxalase/bleomycin resistance/dioxygenase family protein [Yersinia kristensenii]|nr:glyoxalase/bleomycin resistance/dioxygenase family protein [Yersinia kristensenii]